MKGENRYLVVLWDASKGKETAVLEGHAERAQSVAFSPEGETLASGSVDGTVRLGDVAKREEMVVISPGFWVESIAFSPDGNTLAFSVSFDFGGNIHLWDSLGQEDLVKLDRISVEGIMQYHHGSRSRGTNRPSCRPGRSSAANDSIHR